MKFLSLFLISFPLWAAQEPPAELVTVPGTAKKIEYFSRAPTAQGPWPVLLLLHPNQEGRDKIGGKMFTDDGTLAYWAEQGYLAVAVSQPGFGGSDGPPDFCGPESQLAVHLVLDQIRQRKDTKKDSIFLYGGSRGAVVAAMVASQDDHLAGVILRSGLYDFVGWFKNSSWFNPVKLAFVWEVGWPSEEKLGARSALPVASQIKAPLLILHGSRDDRAPLAYAIALAESVQAAGGSAELRTFDSEHVLPPEKIRGLMVDFLKKNRK